MRLLPDRRFLPALLTVCIAVVALASSARAETELTLFDFESGKPWRGGKYVSEPVHQGKQAMEWDVNARPGFDAPKMWGDYSQFDELRFWAYSNKNWGIKMPVLFISENGYYMTWWKVDWTGWKEHRFKLSDFKKAHDPVGWTHVRNLAFRAQGYSLPPLPKGVRLVFDDIRLVSSTDLPYKTLEEWMGQERRKKMAELKSKGNPYHLSVLESLEHAKAKPSIPAKLDNCWQLASMAGRAVLHAWAAGADESPRKGDKVLIAHAVGLIDAILAEQKDGSWIYSRKWANGGDANTDRFTLGPLMDAIYWLRRLPDMDDEWARWEKPLKSVVDFQLRNWGNFEKHNKDGNKAWGTSAYTYPNQDVFHLFEMEMAHRWWGEEGYADSRDRTIAGLQKQLLPDGGWRYIGPETESPGYHNLNLTWLARYLNLTGDKRVRDMIVASVPYYPLTMSNQGIAEFYADCWWKHPWSNVGSSGPDIVAGVSGDERNKWLANRIMERQGAGSSYHSLYAGFLYRADVGEKPLADNWLVFDRNIDGPRGRFGDFYFAGVVGGGARDTFAGCMVSKDDLVDPLKGALMAANIEARLDAKTDRFRKNLYISGHDDVTAVEVMTRVAVLGARYTLRKPYINSRIGREVDPTSWQGTQVWLFTPKGLVGLVEVEALEAAQVVCLRGEMRFGPRMPLTRDKDGLFHCGDLKARVLEHNFDDVRRGNASANYVRKAAEAATVSLRTKGDTFDAKKGDMRFYAANIAPQDAPDASGFARIADGGKCGFSVEVDGVTYRVVFDPISRKISVKSK